MHRARAVLMTRMPTLGAFEVKQPGCQGLPLIKASATCGAGSRLKRVVTRLARGHLTRRRSCGDCVAMSNKPWGGLFDYDGQPPIEIPNAIVDAMNEHCRREAPLEACGILASRIPPRVESIYLLRNELQ